DTHLQQNPLLTRWAVQSALTAFHLSASDDAAVGGDLAFQYARHGTFSGVVFDRAAEALGHTDFAIGAQALQRNLTAGTGATMG
ncbi:MAG: hypothetical protein ACK5V7_09495, partial [bacterium]